MSNSEKRNVDAKTSYEIALDELDKELKQGLAEIEKKSSTKTETRTSSSSYSKQTSSSSSHTSSTSSTQVKEIPSSSGAVQVVEVKSVEEATKELEQKEKKKIKEKEEKEEKEEIEESEEIFFIPEMVKKIAAKYLATKFKKSLQEALKDVEAMTKTEEGREELKKILREAAEYSQLITDLKKSPIGNVIIPIAANAVASELTEKITELRKKKKKESTVSELKEEVVSVIKGIRHELAKLQKELAVYQIITRIFNVDGSTREYKKLKKRLKKLEEEIKHLESLMHSFQSQLIALQNRSIESSTTLEAKAIAEEAISRVGGVEGNGEKTPFEQAVELIEKSVDEVKKFVNTGEKFINALTEINNLINKVTGRQIPKEVLEQVRETGISPEQLQDIIKFAYERGKMEAEAEPWKILATSLSNGLNMLMTRAGDMVLNYLIMVIDKFLTKHGLGLGLGTLPGTGKEGGNQKPHSR